MSRTGSQRLLSATNLSRPGQVQQEHNAPCRSYTVESGKNNKDDPVQNAIAIREATKQRELAKTAKVILFYLFYALHRNIIMIFFAIRLQNFYSKQRNGR
jgi:hypothetical protein